MTVALEMAICSIIRKSKNKRLCIRCNHMEGACSCEFPLWVSKQTAIGKNIVELRKLPKFARLFR